MNYFKGRTISSHDVIFWFGDFNYRISLSGEEVKNAVKAQNFSLLMKHDQLTQQKEAGNVKIDKLNLFFLMF